MASLVPEFGYTSTPARSSPNPRFGLTLFPLVFIAGIDTPIGCYV